VVISAIDGMAGVGKTALALHAAHRLAERFTDGQLFIDLRGHTQGQQPRSAAEALEWLLLALGVPPQRIPQDADERAALYRQRLAGSRTLIVLDNAANEAQIRPLLPGDAGCLVLVTSRRRLKGLDDASTLSLDVLPQADAVALLRSVATRGHEHELMPDPLLAEIADLCGGLPLALRIAAALLRHRPAWSPEHLAALLRDQHQRLGTLFDGDRNLAAVFDLSYQNLGATHQRLFRRLGLLPGADVDAYAAAALADTDPSTATSLLEDLVDDNLLMQHTPGRYWMHDLLRLHARTLAGRDPAHSRDSALERLLNYYQHTAIRADDLVTRFPLPVPAGPRPRTNPTWPTRTPPGLGYAPSAPTCSPPSITPASTHSPTAPSSSLRVSPRSCAPTAHGPKPSPCTPSPSPSPATSATELTSPCLDPARRGAGSDRRLSGCGARPARGLEPVPGLGRFAVARPRP